MARITIPEAERIVRDRLGPDFKVVKLSQYWLVWKDGSQGEQTQSTSLDKAIRDQATIQQHVVPGKDDTNAQAYADAQVTKLLTRQIASAALHRVKHTPDAAARQRMLDHLRFELLHWEEN